MSSVQDLEPVFRTRSNALSGKFVKLPNCILPTGMRVYESIRFRGSLIQSIIWNWKITSGLFRFRINGAGQIIGLIGSRHNFALSAVLSERVAPRSYSHS